MIELANSWLNEVGLRDLRIEVNSIGDDKCRPAYLERLRDYYRPLKAQLHYDSQVRLERNPLRLLDSKAEQDQPFKAKAPKIGDHLCDDCAAHWEAVRRLLDAAGIEYQLNPYGSRARLLHPHGLRVLSRWRIRPAGRARLGGRYDGLAEAEGWPATRRWIRRRRRPGR